MRLRFLGAAGTVTGSKTLVQYGDQKILVDCGLFQGPRKLRERNWARWPFAPSALDAVVLTHAHLDHSGLLPRLIKQGYTGPVYCTAGTKSLCGLLLPDAGYLQEEDAAYANRKGFSRHDPALPLYTRQDAVDCLPHLQPVPFGQTLDLGGGLSLRFDVGGHILGAAMARIRSPETEVLFSGDLGRPDDLLMPAPANPGRAAYLVLESTYGDRLHPAGDPIAQLGEVVARTVARRGVVLIPAFAVGRAQLVLWGLHQLKQRGVIPDIPVYLNSPMSVNATELYLRHSALHRLSEQEARTLCASATLVRSVEESQALNTISGPAVIISASGMLSGGRVLHHLAALAPREVNTVLFVGFQAPGTRGRQLLDGAEEILLHGRYVPIRAEIARIDSLSAHADQGEILRWLSAFDEAPRRVFLNHGEPGPAEALRQVIEKKLGWAAEEVELGQSVELAPARLAPMDAPIALGDPRRRAACEPRIEAIEAHPSYLLAERDPDFLESPGMLPTRLMLEYLKVEDALSERGIEATVVVFGGTRIVEPAEAWDRLRRARDRATAHPADGESQRALAIAERVLAKSHFYDEARDFGRLVGRDPRIDGAQVHVVTGGGPGIMEAANRGAADEGAQTIGLNITLPREQRPNPYITPGLCFQFAFFAIRKMHFLARARALVAFPGGYGTLDELTDALTLIQTGKLPRIPVVLVGVAYWERIFDADFLVAEGVIDPEHAELLIRVDSGFEAWEAIRAFYAEGSKRTARSTGAGKKGPSGRSPA